MSVPDRHACLGSQGRLRGPAFKLRRHPACFAAKGWYSKNFLVIEMSWCQLASERGPEKLPVCQFQGKNGLARHRMAAGPKGHAPLCRECALMATLCVCMPMSRPVWLTAHLSGGQEAPARRELNGTARCTHLQICGRLAPKKQMVQQIGYARNHCVHLFCKKLICYFYCKLLKFFGDFAT